MFPILSIDFGEKHIGLAISDSKGLVASPLKVVNITKNSNLPGIIEEISNVVKEYKVERILVGYPQAFSTNQIQNQERIDKYINGILLPLHLPIIKYDESFSTKIAQSMLVSQGKNYKKNRKRIDSLAATVFLQEYLDNQKL